MSTAKEGTMDLENIVCRMERNAGAVRALVADLEDGQAWWRPDAGSWSVLEVVSHLLDEEREDFRPRIDVVLHRPEEAWSPIDPEGWVVRRGYNQRELGPSLAGFLKEREASVAWLRGLGAADWATSYQAPFGSIRAGDILAAWQAHDLLHLRQLVELKWAYLEQTMKPYEVRYAGAW
jgi:hypothetical protein